MILFFGNNSLSNLIIEFRIHQIATMSTCDVYYIIYGHSLSTFVVHKNPLKLPACVCSILFLYFENPM